MNASAAFPRSPALDRLPPGWARDFLTRFFHQAVAVFSSPYLFSCVNAGIALRSYQLEVARRILHSVLHQQGLTFVVMFPRQSGKNELQAQIESFLLSALCFSGAEIIKVSPTMYPQCEVSIRRLKDTLARGRITRGMWVRESRSACRVGRARISFLSGEAHAHIVGATASTLLEVDEAQDVAITKYDKEIAPMAASTNATRVFWGTAWTSQTLLARELRHARELEAADGIRRVFRIDGDAVAREVPAYEAFLRGQVARLGRSHPMVRTQFYSEEIDEETGMFPRVRQVLMRGDHPRQAEPRAGGIYAFLLDVGGEAPSKPKPGEAAARADANPGGQASTALTVVEVDLTGLGDEVLKAPIYRAVLRKTWQGTGQPELFVQVKALMDVWKPRRTIVDATGIGAGLAAYLQKAYPGRVKPFVFTAASKSSLGWDFLAVCDTGRFKDHIPCPTDADQALFWQQADACQMETAEGPGHHIRWGVPDGVRGADRHPLHDDLLVSAAMCALLDGERFNRPAVGGTFITARDPLEGLDGKY